MAVGKRAKNRRILQLLLAISLVLATLAVIGGIAYSMLTREAGLNKQTLCPAQGPRGHIVLLVDTTDPLTFTQKQAFAVAMRDIVEKVTPEGYLLSLFVLGEDFKETATPIAELCNPGTGADKSELTANVSRLRRQYRNQFVDPLLKQSESLVGQHPAKWSPIFEMLQLVAINGFRRHAIDGERRLIVLSDMLHNTQQLSMYRGTPAFEAFQKEPYGQKMRVDLQGVEVELLYLINAPKLQTRQNLQFWEQFFSKSGARIVSVRPLEG